jgi:hypothetical protein
VTTLRLNVLPVRGLAALALALIASAARCQDGQGAPNTAAYLAKLNAPGQTALPQMSALQTEVWNWAKKHLDDPAVAPTQENLAHLLVVAQRRMHAKAVDLYDWHTAPEGATMFGTVMSDTAKPRWGRCGDSSDFLVYSFDRMKIHIRQIALWNTPGDGHSLVEYFSNCFKKWVFYDPLYGIHLIDRFGTPASMDDILGEIARTGFNCMQWRFRPARITGVNSDAVLPAIDPELAFYVSTGYGIVSNYYFYLAAVRYDDLTPYSTLLGDESIAYGRWHVYDNMALTSLSAAQRDENLSTLLDWYSVRRGGRYYMTIHRLVPEDTVPP